VTGSEVERLEEMAFAAWPAEHVEEHHGWRLRWLGGITRRGNSAWTGRTAGAPPLAARIEHAEAFYAARATTASFHLSPLAPPGLDTLLEERGYVVDAPVSVQTAPLDRVLVESSAAFEVRVSRVPGEQWFALAGAKSRFAASQATYRALLARIGERACYALAWSAGRPVGTSLGVLQGAWLGVSSMLTQPEFRGRGVAGALLRGLCEAARGHGVARMYLQVEQDNTAALRAYTRAAFETAYTTHYRAAPSRPAQVPALRST
jgi:GNAT superfamily N-acetyltransferase